MEFKDSSGAAIGDGITGEISGRWIEFDSPYADVAEVPNGGGFYVYVHRAGADVGDENMARYGTVFRRQLSFPDSPATLLQNQPRRYEDTFQRPAGAVGGRWKIIRGRPLIFDNDPLLGPDGPNTVGPQFDFFSRYMMRYYVPFAGDTITLSIQGLRKGPGMTVVALSCNSDVSQYIYAGFKAVLGGADTVELGMGTDPDIGVAGGNLDPQISPVSFSVADEEPLTTFKIRYDDTTKVLGLYNADYTTEYASWEDSSDLAPHGKGYRYFAIGGSATLINSGVQIAYINAQDDV